MSRENVELVRGMCDAYLTGEPARGLAVLHPQVEWHGAVGGLDEGEVHRGHAAVIGAFVENQENWEQLDLEIEDVLDAGAAIVVLWHETARSRHSEVPLETRTAVVYNVRDGMVVEVRPYMDRAKALEAAGLVG